MLLLSPYVGLAIFPLATLLASNPIRFSWGFRHGSQPMPPDVRDKAENVDSCMSLLGAALTIACTAILMTMHSDDASRVGLSLEKWRSSVAIGTAAGVLLVLFQALLLRLFPIVAPNNVNDYLRRRSLVSSLFVFSVGAVAEEFWIAFCIVSMKSTGHSWATSITVTVVIFALVHFEYRLWGAFAVALKEVISALLFILFGSLIPMVLFHFIGNLGALYWVRRRH